ncbi:hypothetical protein BDM02DRAFT_601030 [Thelephora ganbajun]|uniref:Uncharacterized protein n=1 Tax=Thelephora ganbajun TaxID=370292 RepID=A0ACB6Z832_THEGA|nr:hypothetical protein BDM02DRAFT_601030 [Thelephora ganbajun]
MPRPCNSGRYSLYRNVPHQLRLKGEPQEPVSVQRSTPDEFELADPLFARTEMPLMQIYKLYKHTIDDIWIKRFLLARQHSLERYYRMRDRARHAQLLRFWVKAPGRVSVHQKQRVYLLQAHVRELSDISCKRAHILLYVCNLLVGYDSFFSVWCMTCFFVDQA